MKFKRGDRVRVTDPDNAFTGAILGGPFTLPPLRGDDPTESYQIYMVELDKTLYLRHYSAHLPVYTVNQTWLEKE